LEVGLLQIAVEVEIYWAVVARRRKMKGRADDMPDYLGLAPFGEKVGGHGPSSRETF